MTILRNLRLVRAWAGVAVFLPLAGVWLLIPKTWAFRRRMVVGLWRLMLGCLGVRVEVQGQALPSQGTLFVANHITWTDIPVIGMVLDAAFVAKGDIRDWPIIGKLTAAYGCLFVEREARGRAGDQAAALANHLERARGLVLFPEGTTGLGDGLLPFRSSLFAMVPGVAEGTARVQPICLRYVRHDGSALSAQEQRAVAWIGDDELLPNFIGLAKMGGVRAQVWFEEPVAGGDRKALARGCEAAIAARLASDLTLHSA
jgi:1-acyl-sn-glycerol-3-phosphate acyltransferase